jgi:hypothetical protein
MFSTAFLLAASMVVGQAEADAAVEVMSPRQVMDYFAGGWVCTEKAAGYTGRMTTEWDLHHNVVVGRYEFFGKNFAGTLLSIRVWDPVDKKLRETQFTSWGVFRQAEYDIEPHGDYFKLVGSETETTRKVKKTSDVVLTVQDPNHFIWTLTPREQEGGDAGKEMHEEYSRITGMPLQAPTERPEPKAKKRKQN